jgi:hypothetical protein
VLASPLKTIYVVDKTVEAIKEAIAGLLESERASLATWLVEREYDDNFRERVRRINATGVVGRFDFGLSVGAE